MHWILIVAMIVAVWMFAGCVALALEDRDGRLGQWADRCPLPGGSLWIIAAWPAVLIARWVLR